MFFKATLCALACLFYVISCKANDDLVVVSRDEWGARPPKLVEHMPNPVPFVVIHHSYIPSACSTTEECIQAVQWIQNFHQDDRGWNDIGYSFVVGGDGKAYVGRGWSSVGAHAPAMNNRSIGICMIGDWRTELPPPEQLKAAQNLIKMGVETGKIVSDYTLIAHRQVRETECPGERLFQEISTWPHFNPSINIHKIPHHHRHRFHSEVVKKKENEGTQTLREDKLELLGKEGAQIRNEKKIQPAVIRLQRSSHQEDIEDSSSNSTTLKASSISTTSLMIIFLLGCIFNMLV